MATSTKSNSSIIAEFINRFRDQPAIPKNQRNPCDRDFWWNSSESSTLSHNSNIDNALDFVATQTQNELVTLEDFHSNNELLNIDDTFLSPKPLTVSIVPRMNVENEGPAKFNNSIPSFESHYRMTKNNYDWQNSLGNNDILDQWRIKRAQDITKYKTNTNNDAQKYVNFQQLHKKYIKVNSDLNIKPEITNSNSESDHFQIPTRYNSSHIQQSINTNYDASFRHASQNSQLLNESLNKNANLNSDLQSVCLPDRGVKNISQSEYDCNNSEENILLPENSEEKSLKEASKQTNKQIFAKNRESSIQTDPPLTKNHTVTRIFIPAPTPTLLAPNPMKILSNQASQTNNTNEVQTQTNTQIKSKPDVVTKNTNTTILNTQNEVLTTEAKNIYQIESDDSLWSISSASLDETSQIKNIEPRSTSIKETDAPLNDEPCPNNTDNNIQQSMGDKNSIFEEDELYKLLAIKSEFYEQHILNINKILATMDTTKNN